MYFIAKIGAIGAVGFASTTGASAQALNANLGPDDFLSMEEAPLSETELKEARGGFSFGGFDFNFGVDIEPMTIAPINTPSPNGQMFGPDGLFGDEGVFGEGGVFGDAGPPIGEEGVFGPGGVFGNGDNPSSNAPPPASNPAPTNAPSVNTPALPPTPVVQNTAPASSTTPVVQNTAQAPSTMQGPQNINPTPSSTPAVQNTPAPSTTTVVQNTSPAPSTTPVTNSSGGQSNGLAGNNTGTTTLAGSVQNAPPPPAGNTNTGSNSGGVTNSANVTNTGGGGSSNVSMSAQMSAAGASISRVVQQVGPNGRTLIIDNNMNNVRLTQVVNIDVQVLNFNSRINRAIADSVLATLGSRNHILNAVRN